MGRRISRGRNDKGSPSGRLRIVAGKWRSRRLPVAEEPGLRPTSARIRETLFNWLASTIEAFQFFQERLIDLAARRQLDQVIGEPAITPIEPRPQAFEKPFLRKWLSFFVLANHKFPPRRILK